MLRTILVLGKSFLFLSSSSLFGLPGPPGRAAMGSGSAEADAVGTVWLCCPHTAFLPQASPQTWLLGSSESWEKFASCFFRGSYKKIPIHTKSLPVIGNNHMPKNDNHKFHSFLNSMCYPPAKDTAQVTATCYKNSSKNTYFYHLRISLCPQLLESNATTPNLLQGSIAIMLGSRERHLKLPCQVLSLS